jgi:L-histidine N-alpha-methyltransferase
MAPSPIVQSDAVRDFAAAVAAGLERPGQRELPSMYLYDEVGTALFETITLLPEYGLTRSEERVLRSHAVDILRHVPPPVAVVELGSGTGRKTRWILEALAEREPIAYFPIDISATALQRCHQELGSINAISMVGLEKSYLEGLEEVTARRSPDQTLLVLFLGSTIGNFDPPAADRFLADIRRYLQAGDALLLGTDLEKPVETMLLAYDDPAGVTAAFNLNLLARINRELGGDFVLRNFKHHVRYQPVDRRIEMHLCSTRRQTVSIQMADYSCHLKKGETIWTEACHKYQLEAIPSLAKRAGFTCEAQWIDREGLFAENLLMAE